MPISLRSAADFSSTVSSSTCAYTFDKEDVKTFVTFALHSRRKCLASNTHRTIYLEECLLKNSYHVHELVIAAEYTRYTPVRIQLDGQMLVHVPFS